MPLLDVSDALDPVMLDCFSVQRRVQTINQNGRNVPGTKEYVYVYGVVGPTSPSDLDRTPDLQTMPKTISVVTKFSLQGPSPDYNPDLIVWAGDTYVVRNIEDWSRYGRGYIRAVAGSIDSQNLPPREGERDD